VTIQFIQPTLDLTGRIHHADAAARNAEVADDAARVLKNALSGAVPMDRLLLRAAAGAGKSFVLKRLIVDAVAQPNCARVAVIAFTNNQIHPLAVSLGKSLGADRVCLFVAKERFGEIPNDARANATIATSTNTVPIDSKVVISTCHRLGAPSELRRMRDHFGPGWNGDAPFDVLFVDEAWQLPHYLFDRVAKAAPIAVGVGDVGQLPPLEIGANPWRGDPRYNPYRAWPTEFNDVDDARTVSVELPAVWRPAAGHLDLWRAFYPDWGELNCIAAPGDRSLVANGLTGEAAAVWTQVGTGVPTLLEAAGLREAEAPDIDLPLMEIVESLLDDLLSSGFVLVRADYDDTATPTGSTTTQRPGDGSADPLLVILATRNQAVDDATDVVERLRQKHSLGATDVVASTVDSWQGQTNGMTIAVHPLNGATELDEFNSAFGRLAVTCTRATHGLLMVCRPGLVELLNQAPPRPGTPFGEPGNRHLPRQTHQRILASFARGTLTIDPSND
jgi:AAA domain